MVVVGIIGILAGVALPRYELFQVRARQAEGKANLGVLYKLQQTYIAQEGRPANMNPYGQGHCSYAEMNNNIIGFSLDSCEESFYTYRIRLPVGAITVSGGVVGISSISPIADEFDIEAMDTEDRVRPSCGSSGTISITFTPPETIAVVAVGRSPDRTVLTDSLIFFKRNDLSLGCSHSNPFPSI